MKKHDRPLKLSTETVRPLHTTQLAVVGGGLGPTVVTVACVRSKYCC